MLNSMVINQIDLLSVSQKLDLMQYSIRKLGKAKYSLLYKHYILKKTDKEIGESTNTSPHIIFRERTKYLKEYAEIVLENFRQGLGFNPDRYY
jgi:hypothetical protein